MLLSATTSRKKQQADLIQSQVHQEEEKRRRERESFNITAVSVLNRASHEPSLYIGTGSGDDKDESKDTFTLKKNINCIMLVKHSLKEDVTSMPEGEM